MQRNRRAAKVAVVLVLVGAAFATDEVRREYRFKVHHRASVSIVNQYGPISVKPGSENQVVVTAILHSDKVEVEQDQAGSRISVASHLLPGADATRGVWNTRFWCPLTPM